MCSPEDHCSNFVTLEQLQFKDFSPAMASKEIMGPFKDVIFFTKKGYIIQTPDTFNSSLVIPAVFFSFLDSR